MAKKSSTDKSLTIVAVFFLIAASLILVKLFKLQIFDHRYYSALALDKHEIYRQLNPSRGNIYIQDMRTEQEHPVAINRPYFLIYAVPRDIDKGQVVSTTNYLAELFELEDEDKTELLKKLSKDNDPYELVASKVLQAKADQLRQADIKGINQVVQNYRYYPESQLTSHVLGFVGAEEDGSKIGRYGIEGSWEKIIAGQSGFLSGKRNAAGGLILSAGRTLQAAQDGADLLLTIDRSVQLKTCQTLEKGFTSYKAQSAAAVMLNAKTGAVVSMCSLPNFDPNNYFKVDNISVYNNSAVFTAYEPGSVFKPITMAAALDAGLVNPNTRFSDPGVRVIDGYKVKNALDRNFGDVSMTEVLEESVNTGMIWVAEQIGRNRFRDYVEKFGFGRKTGINLDTEVAGDISSLSKPADIYTANASFGQGFTATPLQLATAYTALANNGKLSKPFIVEEVRYPDGRVEATEPQITETVISPRAQKLITGMMTSVVEKGHGFAAKLKNHYVAGKTGTAQIAKEGKYSEESNHTFVGYFPADNPQFVLVVRYETPQRAWAADTAAPTFAEIADFTLNYYNLKGDR